MYRIKSMTGFASQSCSLQSGGSCTVTVRTLNSRFADLTLNLPAELAEHEQSLRKICSAYIKRGKADIVVSADLNQTATPEINHELLDLLCNEAKKLSAAIPGSTVNITDILLHPNVLTLKAASTEIRTEELLNLFEQTLRLLDTGRTAEGEALKQILADRLTQIEKLLAIIHENLQRLVEDERNRIREKIKELGISADPSRIESETALAAQKSDIAEEYDRMCTHVKKVRELLEHPQDSNGKRLDFLVQEMMRESNTIASKAGSDTVSMIAVELKVLVEQMREQIQNIE